MAHYGGYRSKDFLRINRFQARILNLMSGPSVQIEYSQFLSVDIRVGTIVEATDFPEARKPSYRLVIDFGHLGRRTSSAQITGNYQPQELVGRQVLAVVNFAVKPIASFRSEVLTLGVDDTAGNVVLISPDRQVENGSRLY